MDVLAAFVRKHSKERKTDSDVQAAVTVIGRRIPEHDDDRQRIDLAHAELLSVNLGGAHLRRADLTGAILVNADLFDADLSRAKLTGAKLGGAYLLNANLTEAILVNADLAGAKLTPAAGDPKIIAGVNLAGAILTGADFDGAVWPQGQVVPPGWQRDTDGSLRKAATNPGGD